MFLIPQPIGLMVSSPHLTVASLVNIRLAFPAPPQDATITSIQGIISQSFTISYSDSSKVATPPPQQLVLSKVNPKAKEATPPGSPRARHEHHYHPRPAGRAQATAQAQAQEMRPSRSTSPRRASGASPSPGPARGVSSREGSMSPRSTRIWTATGAYPYPGGERVPDVGVHCLTQGEEYIYSRVMRVPDDNFVRPTTLAGSDSRIKVAHTIGVELRFRTALDPVEKVMTLTQVATIASVSVESNIVSSVLDSPRLMVRELRLCSAVACPSRSSCRRTTRLARPPASASQPTPATPSSAAPASTGIDHPHTTHTNHTRPVLADAAIRGLACSVDDLYDRDGEQLQQAGRIEVDPNAEALVLGVDRQNKTPSVSEIERWRRGQPLEQGASGKVVPVEDE